MIDRQLLGDVVFAAIVAIPAAALARPESVPRAHPGTFAVSAQKSAVALASAADREVGLFR